LRALRDSTDKEDKRENSEHQAIQNCHDAAAPQERIVRKTRKEKDPDGERDPDELPIEESAFIARKGLHRENTEDGYRKRCCEQEPIDVREKTRY
jgi:hypothetical protein